MECGKKCIFRLIFLGLQFAVSKAATEAPEGGDTASHIFCTCLKTIHLMTGRTAKSGMRCLDVPRFLVNTPLAHAAPFRKIPYHRMAAMLSMWKFNQL
jgi:hypothetical protein